MNNQYQRCLLWRNAPKLTNQEKRWIVSDKNPNNPFSDFVGNDETVERLKWIAFEAIGHPKHFAHHLSFALLGPAGVGKTTLAQKFSKLVGLPFINIRSSVRNTQEVYEIIAGELAKPIYFHEDGANADLTLQPYPSANEFILPPCIIFIDECHNLCDPVQQGLLTATEPNSHRMETTEGIKIDTRFVCWVLATTDRGQLFDAFDTRFAKLTLKPYTKQEIAKIVFNHNSGVPFSVCEAAAKYAGRVTREAIQFVKEVKLCQSYNGFSWEEAIEKVREGMRIDEYGMTQQRLNILIELGQRPASLNRLAQVAGVKEEELVKFILPPLKEHYDDIGPLVTSSHRHFITSNGIKELDKRRISHNGDKALPKK